MAKKKGSKRNAGRFAGIPVSLMREQKYIELNYKEKALLLELAFQYNGHNNGNLTACHSVLKKRGFPAASLWRAVAGLAHMGFVVVTRQGFKRRGFPTLLALTYQPIDEPPASIRYDQGVKPSPVALNFWCKDKNGWSIQPDMKDPREKLPTSK